MNYMAKAKNLVEKGIQTFKNGSLKVKGAMILGLIILIDALSVGAFYKLLGMIITVYVVHRLLKKFNFQLAKTEGLSKKISKTFKQGNLFIKGAMILGAFVLFEALLVPDFYKLLATGFVVYVMFRLSKQAKLGQKLSKLVKKKTIA